MEQQIIDLIQSKFNTYNIISNEISIEKIYNLLINNIIYDPTNTIENYYLGWYYEMIIKDYDLMKKYYLNAIEDGCSVSMNRLGIYYKMIEINYDLMKKILFNGHRS
jgi:hypothetical protein